MTLLLATDTFVDLPIVTIFSGYVFAKSTALSVLFGILTLGLAIATLALLADRRYRVGALVLVLAVTIGAVGLAPALVAYVHKDGAGPVRHAALSADDWIKAAAAEGSFWVGGTPMQSRRDALQPPSRLWSTKADTMTFVCHDADGNALQLRSTEGSTRAAGLRVTKRTLDERTARDMEEPGKLNLIPSFIPLGEVRTEQVRLEVIEAAECLAGLSGQSRTPDGSFD